MVFDPNRPIASENLSDSQPLLLSNNQALNNTYGIDHYQFSDTTPNGGFHKTVTNPAQGSIPTTTTNPVLFGFQQTANLGVLQYSRGPNDAVITPLTSIYSPSTPLSVSNSGSTPVFDFTGIALAQATVFFTFTATSGGTNNMQEWILSYQTGPVTKLTNLAPAGSGTLILQFSGSVLSIVSNGTGAATNLFWSLDFTRIQT